MRPVPQCALDLIRQFEGWHDGDKRTPNTSEPEPDPVGIYTVGWGYALFEGGKPIKDRAAAMRVYQAKFSGGLTRQGADELLRTVAQSTCDRVCTLLPNVTLSDNELGALVCLTYNIGAGEAGAGGFGGSTVRRRLLAGDRQGAADAFLMWVKAGGKTLPGLVRRREAERALFLAK